MLETRVRGMEWGCNGWNKTRKGFYANLGIQNLSSWQLGALGVFKGKTIQLDFFLFLPYKLRNITDSQKTTKTNILYKA